MSVKQSCALRILHMQLPAHSHHVLRCDREPLCLEDWHTHEAFGGDAGILIQLRNQSACTITATQAR